MQENRFKQKKSILQTHFFLNYLEYSHVYQLSVSQLHCCQYLHAKKNTTRNALSKYLSECSFYQHTALLLNYKCKIHFNNQPIKKRGRCVKKRRKKLYPFFFYFWCLKLLILVIVMSDNLYLEFHYTFGFAFIFYGWAPIWSLLCKKGGPEVQGAFVFYASDVFDNIVKMRATLEEFNF